MTDRFDTRFEATELGVRQTLKTVMRFLTAQGVQPSLTGNVELVLAEVLNNIVEHAYGTDAAGAAELQCRIRLNRIDLTVLDKGKPVPVHIFAKRESPATDVLFEDLPEGGFGWFLIQKMTENLVYQRVEGTNVLRFSILAEPET